LNKQSIFKLENSKIMKTKFLTIILTLSMISACEVDDYQDANPPHPKDGPAGFLSIGSDAIVDTETNGTTYTYVPINGTAFFDIDVVDAPGQIDSVGAALSRDLGVVAIDLSAQGEVTGLVRVTYTAGSVFSSGAGTAGNEDITIDLFDAQNPRKSVAFAPDRIKTVNATCFSSRPLVGFYDTVSSGFDAETGTNYTDLEGVVEFRINAGGVNHPGFYRLTDGSFGLYPEQGYAANLINVTVCGNEIVNADEEFANNFSGTLNSDGTITITWSNTFGDTGTTVMTPR
jgi:hypothetical protein